MGSCEEEEIGKGGEGAGEGDGQGGRKGEREMNAPLTINFDSRKRLLDCPISNSILTYSGETHAPPAAEEDTT